MPLQRSAETAFHAAAPVVVPLARHAAQAPARPAVPAPAPAPVRPTVQRRAAAPTPAPTPAPAPPPPPTPAPAPAPAPQRPAPVQRTAPADHGGQQSSTGAAPKAAAPAAASEPGPSSPEPPAPAEIDELARRLVAPLSRLLRAELRGDRERLGRLRDHGR
ncbi:hypothetical protein [Streptomyces formicae]